VPWPLLKFPSLELASFNRSQGKISYLSRVPMQPKKLQNLKFYKNSKQTNIKQKAWKRKNENMKLEELGSLPQVVVLFVCPPPPTRTRKQWMYMWKFRKQEIRVSNTTFSKNQALNRNFKHSSIFFSFKKHLFTQTCCRAKWTQFKST
jgi:hypothetical protein